jgi:hypothetical protein
LCWRGQKDKPEEESTSRGRLQVSLLDDKSREAAEWVKKDGGQVMMEKWDDWTKVDDKESETGK